MSGVIDELSFVDDLVVDAVEGREEFLHLSFRGEDQIDAHAQIAKPGTDLLPQLGYLAFPLIIEKDRQVNIAVSRRLISHSGVEQKHSRWSSHLDRCLYRAVYLLGSGTPILAGFSLLFGR